jgi:hypothetical protein
MPEDDGQRMLTAQSRGSKVGQISNDANLIVRISNQVVLAEKSNKSD